MDPASSVHAAKMNLPFSFMLYKDALPPHYSHKMRPTTGDIYSWREFLDRIKIGTLPPDPFVSCLGESVLPFETHACVQQCK